MNWKVIRWVDIYLGIPLAYLVFCLKSILGARPDIDAKDGYKSILLVKFWGLGNVVMLLPATRALKDKYPRARIDLLTLASNKEISQAAGIFDGIYTINTDNPASFIRTTFRHLIGLRKNKYDLLIDFEQFARFSSLLCAFIGGKTSIGFNTFDQHRQFLYTRTFAYNDNMHVVRSFCKLAQLAGADIGRDFGAAPLVCREDDLARMNRLLFDSGVKKHDFLVLLHAGTSENFSLRRWPGRYFAELADKLIEKHGVKIIFSGLPQEHTLVQETIGLMSNKEVVLDLSGRIRFGEFLSLIKLSDLLICADTGPIHLASGLSVPAIGLYGPNTPLLYGPWGEVNSIFYKKLPCSPCITNYNAKINKCRHPEGEGACMRKIGVDEVLADIEIKYLGDNRKYTNLRWIKDECVAGVS